MQKHLFISIKPEFSKKIIIKEKTIELRKIKPNISIDDYIIIYATNPMKAIVGFGTVQEIIETTPEKMWHKYSSELGISKPKFDNYFNKKSNAVGIKIKDVYPITPIYLEDLRKIIPNFQPPQIYKYISDADFQAIKNYQANSIFNLISFFIIK